MPEGIQPNPLFVILADEVTSGQLAVSQEAYQCFEERFDAALSELESRFGPLAAPSAGKIRRRAKPR